MRRIPLSVFEDDPSPIIDQVERDGKPAVITRDGADVLLVLPTVDADGAA